MAAVEKAAPMSVSPVAVTLLSFIGVIAVLTGTYLVQQGLGLAKAGR
jgi:hypothetical protein